MAGLGLECDEYPRAMFTEGGGLATHVCVPSSQNSRLQGPILSNIQRYCGLKKGDKVLVRLIGGCSQFNFPARQARDLGGSKDENESGALGIRDITPQGTFSNSSSFLLDPYGDKSLTYVGIPLDELDAGHYDLEVRFSGQEVVRAEVLNQYGESYAAIDNPSSSGRLTFDIDDDLALSASLIAYTVEQVNLSFSGTVRLANASNTPNQNTAATQTMSWSLAL
ncbi:hypothetical protein VTK56DRAFT_6023 [Thermocarpiscus australiensis]